MWLFSSVILLKFHMDYEFDVGFIYNRGRLETYSKNQGEELIVVNLGRQCKLGLLLRYHFHERLWQVGFF